MNWNFVPTYFAIKQDIKEKIAKGVLLPGELLPGRKSMCDQYQCSWSTLNRAVNELILEGVLTAEKGKGTYVSNRGSEPGEQERTLDTVNVWVCNPFPSVYALMSEMIDGMRDEAHRRGVSVRILDLAEPAAIPSSLNDFIVVTPSNDQWATLVEARNRGDRFVVLNSSWDAAPFPCIDADIYGAATEATRILLQRGHRAIGLVGIREGFSNYDRRVEGFRRAFEDAGVRMDPEWIVGRPEERDVAKRIYEEWLDRHPECTALFTADYATSMLLLELLQDKGIPVPDRLSLFATGTPQFAPYGNLSVSAVVQPFHEMGRLAARRLLERELTPGAVLLPCRLNIGNSIKSL
ncbi:GntR family transcriptional regulator [Paenibacillus sp.]|uniref:GntR family transcriptional regulator n=1 Tax=Paenibacillus sp. TaxID=58172 RepID=UPI002D63464A|nr:GntR family transcriptional regulator [Paenibacillus sp.]HZG85561.1 GntR family transcriptional regulator [Paenibacillus sp.]